MKETAERILDAALDLFSRDGYEAVGIEHIAAAVGIKGPSIYKHFKSKQDLFDTLIRKMSARYEEHTPFYRNLDVKDLTPEKIADQTLRYIRFSVHDPYISKVRRLLTLEQYRNPAVAAIQEKRVYGDLLRFHREMIELLISEGILKDGDAGIMALQYVAPVSLQLYRVDRDPSLEEEAIGIIEKHINSFFEVYGRKK